MELDLDKVIDEAIDAYESPGGGALEIYTPTCKFNVKTKDLTPEQKGRLVRFFL